jgi:hypothetical protein
MLKPNINEGMIRQYMTGLKTISNLRSSSFLYLHIGSQKFGTYIVGSAIRRGRTQTVMIDTMVKVKVVRRFDGDLMKAG